jgi:hypothetical protein
MNNYLTYLGDILPDVTDLIHSIDHNDYHDKNPGYFQVKKVINKDDLTLADAVLKTRLLKNINKFARHSAGKKIVDWYQNSINEDIKEKIYASLPDFIREQNTTVMIQIASQGMFLPIHKDHERRSSLFYLVSGDNYETRWYRPVQEFDSYYSHIIDPSFVEETYKTQLAKSVWYAFNNEEYHSVHKIQDGDEDRVSFLIEFVDMSYQDLLALLDKNKILTQNINKATI